MAGILDTNLTTTPAVKAATPIGPAKPPVTDDQIKSFWTTNKIGQGQMSDKDMFDAMDLHGITPEKLTSVMGDQGAAIAQRYTASKTPAATTPPTTDTAAPPAGSLNSSIAPVMKTVDLNDPQNTVEGRVNNLMTSSPLRQTALRESNQASNRAGTLNSSMNAGAATRALFDEAGKIATTDANNRTLNAQFNVNQENSGTLAKFNADYGIKQIETQGAEQFKLNSQKFGYDTDLQKLVGGQNLTLADKQATYNQILQKMVGEQNMTLTQAKAALDSQLQDKIGAQKLGEITATATAQAGLDAAKARDNYNLQVLAGNQQAASDLAKASSAYVLQQLQGAQQTKLQDSVNKNNQLISSNQLATTSMMNRTQTIRGILENPDITPEVKQQMIDKEIGLFDTELSAIKKLSETNVSSTLSTTAALSENSKAAVEQAKTAGTQGLATNEAALGSILDDAVARGTTTSELLDAAGAVLPAGATLGSVLSYIQAHGYKFNANGTISK